MNWAAFLRLLSAKHCTGGASSAMTLSTNLDTLGRALLTDDVVRTRQPVRMSRHPVDRASPSLSACIPRDGMRKTAISAGATLPARTSAHWHFHIPIFSP